MVFVKCTHWPSCCYRGLDSSSQTSPRKGKIRIHFRFIFLNPAHCPISCKKIKEKQKFQKNVFCVQNISSQTVRHKAHVFRFNC